VEWLKVKALNLSPSTPPPKKTRKDFFFSPACVLSDFVENQLYVGIQQSQKHLLKRLWSKNLLAMVRGFVSRLCILFSWPIPVSLHTLKFNKF
jgi:hypothetical protein